MFIEYIERLRKEPPDVRRRAVAYWTTIIVVAIAVLYIVYRTVVGSLNDPGSDYRSSNIAAPYQQN